MNTDNITRQCQHGIQKTAMSFVVLALSSFKLLAVTTNWTVVSWNNLGMHCMDSDYSVFSILPPYNTIHAQIIMATNGYAVRVTNSAAYSVTYQAIADPSGSINSTSLGKGNFAQYSQALFGVALPQDQGLPVPGPNSYFMPGPTNAHQAMGYENTYSWFAAYGIPLSPYDDSQRKNPYPMMRVTAMNGATALASTDIVLPVSDEMDCRLCHASGSGPAAKPSAGWVIDSNSVRDYRLNILRLHDQRQAADPLYSAALAARGLNSNGLYAGATNGQPVLCAACHLSEALPNTGYPGIEALTRAIHIRHSGVIDPRNGLNLESEANRTTCYTCHPGSATRCLRGAMGKAIAADGTMEMQCQSCHGSMSAVAAANRTGWIDEPNCQSCHTGTATQNNGQIRYTSSFSSPGVMRVAANTTFATTPNAPAPGASLYRFSQGHGGLYCEACHGSTHAEFPSSHPNDNITSTQHQGHAGKLVECTSCHGTNPSTLNGGPHGMHPVGQVWVSGHTHYAEGNQSQCQACHGTDYRGTVLSRSQANRTLNSRAFWAGQQIGCYDCHNGPGGPDSGSAPSQPTVANVSGTTSVNNAFTLTLSASASNLRIVAQPANGVIALSNNIATYYPAPGFVGTETFTFSASSGYRDSLLATGTITVVSGSCDYIVTPSSQSMGEAGGIASISVTVPGCANVTNVWNASSDFRWLTMIAGGGTNGTDTVSYRVARNTGPARTGTLMVAGHGFTVSQAAATIQQPMLGNLASASGNLGMNGGGGKANMLYYILASPDLTAPAASWTRAGTNYFDADGNFLFTTRVDASRSGEFFRIQQP